MIIDPETARKHFFQDWKPCKVCGTETLDLNQTCMDCRGKEPPKEVDAIQEKLDQIKRLITELEQEIENGRYEHDTLS